MYLKGVVGNIVVFPNINLKKSPDFNLGSQYKGTELKQSKQCKGVKELEPIEVYKI